MREHPYPVKAQHRLARWLWLVLGLLCAAVGLVGVIVPGLPTTVFMIVAAGCFARSSPRLEQWILELPGIGSAVQDYRSGLGMRRRAKIWAISMIAVASTSSAVLILESLTVRLVVLTVGLIGIWFVGLKVPTREKVISEHVQGTEPGH